MATQSAYFAVIEAWGCGGDMTPNQYVDLFRQRAIFLKPPEGARPIIIASGGNDDDTLAADLKIHPNTTQNTKGKFSA